MDWDAFETAWHDYGCHTLADLAAAHPGERLYAAAFHLFYGDSTCILSPALAANTEAAVHEVVVDENHRYSTRFNPPDWRWNAESDPMTPWYERLTEEVQAAAGTEAERDAESDALWAAHDGAMARVCRTMTATARRGGIHDLLPSNFVVVILDFQRGNEEAADLIRASVDPQVLATVPGLVDALRELDGA